MDPVVIPKGAERFGKRNFMIKEIIFSIENFISPPLKHITQKLTNFEHGYFLDPIFAYLYQFQIDSKGRR